MKRPTVLVLGHARHGKDTVGGILAWLYGYCPGASSEFACVNVMMPFFEEAGFGYEDWRQCFDDRIHHRSVWYDVIREYNQPDPSRLAREMIADGHDAYVGMRSPEELEATRHLFDIILWVDASRRGVPTEPRSSMGIVYDPATMVLIDNGGIQEDLDRAVAAVMDPIIEGKAAA